VTDGPALGKCAGQFAEETAAFRRSYDRIARRNYVLLLNDYYSR